MKIWTKIFTISLLGLSLIGCGGGSKGTSALGERSFLGKVTDTVGTPLSNIKIVDLFTTQETNTDENGDFFFVDLPVTAKMEFLVTTPQGQDSPVSFDTPEISVISLALTMEDGAVVGVKIGDFAGDDDPKQFDSIADPASDGFNSDNDRITTGGYSKKKKGGKKKSPNGYGYSGVDLDDSSAQFATGGEAEEVASTDGVSKFNLDDIKENNEAISSDEPLDISSDNTVQESPSDSSIESVDSTFTSADDNNNQDSLSIPPPTPTGIKNNK